jgi:chemotaxis protein CheX
MSAPVVLPARVDLSCVERVAGELRDVADHPLALDAGSVTFLGGLGLQVLLAAASERRAAGGSMTITAASDAFLDALAQFGISTDDITTGVKA